MQDDVATIMADSFYLPYLLVLVLVPLLVRWRWGIAATLVVTFIEVALVGLAFYLMAVYHLLPEVFVGEPPPDEHCSPKCGEGRRLGLYSSFFSASSRPARR